VRSREVGDRQELREPEVPRRGLRLGRTEEQAALTESLGETIEPELDCPVQLADGVEVLQPRRDLILARRGQGSGLLDRGQGVLVGHVHAVRALEVDEVPDRGLVERKEVHPDPRRVGVRRQREVRAAEG
jgi:hypothetical protein